jgi:hypothetical protein
MKNGTKNGNDYVTKKDLTEVLDDAVAQIVGAVSKTLENYPTKDDVKDFVTKDDLKILATKDDLEDVKTELKTEIREIKGLLNDLKADTPTPQEIQNHEQRILKLEKTVLTS